MIFSLTRGQRGYAQAHQQQSSAIFHHLDTGYRESLSDAFGSTARIL
jgi:hypothetical protein